MCTHVCVYFCVTSYCFTCFVTCFEKLLIIRTIFVCFAPSRIPTIVTIHLTSTIFILLYKIPSTLQILCLNIPFTIGELRIISVSNTIL